MLFSCIIMDCSIYAVKFYPCLKACLFLSSRSSNYKDAITFKPFNIHESFVLLLVKTYNSDFNCIGI